MRLISFLIAIALLINLSGCTVVSVAVGATTAVVGGVIEVVDVVTPDIIDDDDEEEEEEEDRSLGRNHGYYPQPTQNNPSSNHIEPDHLFL